MYHYIVFTRFAPIAHGDFQWEEQELKSENMKHYAKHDEQYTKS
jgi:hypothetical protein